MSDFAFDLDERERYKRIMLTMRGHCYAAYEASKFRLEQTLGFMPNFEEYLVTQLLMFQMNGPPRPDQRLRNHPEDKPT